MTTYTTYRSYHGAGVAKAVLFYWPGTSKEVAKALEDEMASMDWLSDKTTKELSYIKAKFLRERLGDIK